MTRTPSMTALRAFEAVVRHGSITGAAQELCVTPAAISHRLNDLRALCATELVERVNGSFRATPHGLAVLDHLGDAFQRIREAHDFLVCPARKPVEAVVSYSFAVMWLLPNLADFQERFPDIRISIQPSHKPISDSRSSTSLTIVHSEDRPEGAGWERLFEDICAIVASSNHPIFRDPQPAWRERLTDYQLVHVSHDSGAKRGELSWRDWGAMAGVSHTTFPVGLHVTAEHAALDLALAGRSLSIVSLVNADSCLRAGKAAVVEGSQILSGKSYWMKTWTAAKDTPPEVQRFGNWLRASVSDTALRLKEQMNGCALQNGGQRTAEDGGPPTLP